MLPSRRKKWFYFKKIDANIALCKICMMKIKFCGNTLNLVKHLRRHSNILTNPDKQQLNTSSPKPDIIFNSHVDPLRFSNSDLPIRRKHLTEEQREILISFMELHGDLCSHTYTASEGRKRKQTLMEELSQTLNRCANGVVRTPREWTRTWTDNKSKTRTKAITLSRYAFETGKGSSADTVPLTPWEERIVRLAHPELATKLNILKIQMIESCLDEPTIINNTVQDIEITETTQIADAFQLSDHEYTNMRNSSSSESEQTTEVQGGPTIVQQISSLESSEPSMEEMMLQMIKAQEATSNSILQLADAIREGCKTIAESIIAKTPRQH